MSEIQTQPVEEVMQTVVQNTEIDNSKQSYYELNKQKVKARTSLYYQMHKQEISRKSKQRRKNRTQQQKQRDRLRRAQRAAKNRQKKRQMDRDYYKRNRQKLLQYQKQYRTLNYEKIQQRSKKWRQKNKQKISQRMKEYYQENRQKLIQKSLDFKLNNPELYKERHERYVKVTNQRHRNNPLYIFSQRIRARIRSGFRKIGGVKDKSTELILGCSFQQLHKYLVKTYEDNYGQPCPEDLKQVHIDHIIPINVAETQQEILALNHWSNLQLLKPKDNLQKRARLDWSLS